MFATCSDDTTVCLWDTRYLKHKARILCKIFIPKVTIKYTVKALFDNIIHFILSSQFPWKKRVTDCHVCTNEWFLASYCRFAS